MNERPLKSAPAVADRAAVGDVRGPGRERAHHLRARAGAHEDLGTGEQTGELEVAGVVLDRHLEVADDAPAAAQRAVHGGERVRTAFVDQQPPADGDAHADDVDVCREEAEDRRAGRRDAASGDRALEGIGAFHRAQRRGDVGAVEFLLIDPFADVAERFDASRGKGAGQEIEEDGASSTIRNAPAGYTPPGSVNVW